MAVSTDLYCYQGTDILINRANFVDADRLAVFEEAWVGIRLEEGLPSGSLTVADYCAVHRHLFGDVYHWAGQFRTTRISKGSSMFCYPEHIADQMKMLFGGLGKEHFLRELASNAFANALAMFLGELNAIHAFREGNGRTQLIFCAKLAHSAGYPLALENIEPDRFLSAMIASFNGHYAPLQDALLKLIR